MGKSERTMAAGVFKAKCLAVLDEVEKTGKSLVVTKRGRPVARVSPLTSRKGKGAPLAGSVVYEGDLVAPLSEPWESR